MRKKLIDLGIPSGGPKALLVRRHTEWVNLVNANYDSSRPRTKRELLHDLSEWDRSQGRVVPHGLGQVTNANSVMSKDFDGTAWSTAHSTDFQQLIQDARRRGPQKPDDTLGFPSKISKNSSGSEDDPKSEGVSMPEGVSPDVYHLASGGVSAAAAAAVPHDDEVILLE